MSRSTRVKPLLFRINHGQTIGDQKPLAILAVHAAAAAASYMKTTGIQIPLTSRYTVPVTLSSFDFLASRWLVVIQRFAQHLIGPDYERYLNIEFKNELSAEVQDRQFMVFDVSIWDGGRGSRIFLDFGDSTSVNRFTSRVLDVYRPKSNYFGSLFLPLIPNFLWSSPKASEELNDIAELQNLRGYRILTIAGSMKPPFRIEEIIEWLEKDRKEDFSWFVILVGYYDLLVRSHLLATIEQFPNSIYCMRNHVEYEDLVRVSNFFVSNCGAGSTIAPILAGCPQLCRIRNTVGSDKRYNAKVVAETKRLGPDDLDPETGTFWVFDSLMKNIDRIYPTYIENVTKAREDILREENATRLNLANMFTAIFQSSDLQRQIQRSGLLPVQYGLQKPEEEDEQRPLTRMHI